jgi:glyoxylase-like metal-dependent hydrolase (beta-lactamase superfamily II)
MLWKKCFILSLSVLLLIVGTIVAQQAPAPQGQQPGQGGGGGQRGGGGGGGAAQAIRPVPGKQNLYMVTGAGGNSTVRVTNDGIILVDTKNLGEQFYNGLMEQIKTVSTAPVRFAAITHVHQDHSGNTELFIKNGAQVVAHENLKKNLETYNPQQGKPATPNVLYAKEQTIKVGNAEARVYHFGAGHTSGDSYVYFPDLRVISTGDAFAGTNLNCDYANGGSILSWARVLDAVAKLDFDTIIPGHEANPMTKADLQAAQARLAKIVSTAIALVKKGTPKDQLVAQITAADANLNLGALLQQNNAANFAIRLDGFYNEIVAAAK